MASSDQPVTPLQRGGDVTLLDTDKANELIRAVNVLTNMLVKVQAQGSSQIAVTSGNAVLTISLAGVPVDTIKNQGAVTGSRGGNAALASLLTTLAKSGIITDSTT